MILLNNGFKNCHRLYKISIVSVFSFFISVGMARADNFPTLLTDMMANQPALKASLYDVYTKGQLYDVNIAQAFNPTVGFVGNFQQTYAKTSGSANPLFNYDGDYRSNSYGIQLKQNIFNGGIDSLKIQNGRALFHLTEWQYLNTEQTLILQSATAYTNVVKYRKTYQLRLNSNKRMRQVLEAARLRFAAGTITRSDLARSESLAASDEAQLVAARTQFLTAVDEFNRLFGRPPPDNLEPIDPYLNAIALSITKRNEGSREKWLRDFEYGNPNLQMARLQKEIADIQKKTNINSFFPKVDLTLTGSYVETNQPNQPPRTQALVGGISVTMPLWFQGALTAGSRSAIGAAKVASYQYVDAAQKLQVQFNRAEQDYKAALLAEKSYSDALKSARLALEAGEIERTTGKITLLDYMQILNSALDTEINLLNAQQNRVVAMLQLQALTGDLTANNFGLKSPYRLTERNRSYRGALDPFSDAFEWVFDEKLDNMQKDFQQRFQENHRRSNLNK